MKVVDQLADGLDTLPQDLETLHQVRDGHLKRLLWDHMRKSIHDYVPGTPRRSECAA